MASLSRQLLAQADALNVVDQFRPVQANLRRAISGAYYSLFHMVVAAGCDRLLRGQASKFRPLMARAFEDKPMAAACGRWATANIPKHWAGHLTRESLEPDLITVAKVLQILQRERNIADYDVAAKYYRTGVGTHIQRAREAHDAWDRVKGHDQATLFLLDVLGLAGRS